MPIYARKIQQGEGGGGSSSIVTDGSLTGNGSTSNPLSASPTLQQAKNYTDQTALAFQHWYPAVETKAELDAITPTDGLNHLCRVMADAVPSNNGVWQWIAGGSDWTYYSDNADFIDETELDDKLADYVDLTTEQTITGKKTFNVSPILPAGEVNRILSLDNNKQIVPLPAGTAGQVLTSNGAGLAPSFQNSTFSYGLFDGTLNTGYGGKLFEVNFNETNNTGGIYYVTFEMLWAMPGNPATQVSSFAGVVDYRLAPNSAGITTDTAIFTGNNIGSQSIQVYMARERVNVSASNNYQYKFIFLVGGTTTVLARATNVLASMPYGFGEITYFHNTLILATTVPNNTMLSIYKY
jgi:hypothetical protein